MKWVMITVLLLQGVMLFAQTPEVRINSWIKKYPEWRVSKELRQYRNYEDLQCIEYIVNDQGDSLEFIFKKNNQGNFHLSSAIFRYHNKNLLKNLENENARKLINHRMAWLYEVIYSKKLPVADFRMIKGDGDSAGYSWTRDGLDIFTLDPENGEIAFD